MPSPVRQPADLNPRSDPPLDFPDRDLRSMSAADYDELGFLCGLEVHQQLATRGKLFCRCPAGRYVRTFDAEVLRHMRPTLSELGEYDGTALMEFKTRKEIVYLLERSTVCTYELDDTPPFPPDEEAIRIALHICQLFELNLVSELHVMRKQYLDGSIPTGFQRTIMLGLDGRIPFRVPPLGVDRELRIRQLSLEEDSCREVSDVGHRITFRTDRLGMPLTEVVTEPELRTPWEAQAGARLVAATTRVARRVRRGPGAARQDVNVSVAGGRRIELKGVHHHRHLPLLVHIEAFRQLNLLRLRAEMERRGLTEDSFVLPDGTPWDVSPRVVDVTSRLRNATLPALRQSLERGGVVVALRLPEAAGLLNHPTQPGLPFAHEIAERLRVIACLESRPFMTHDEAPERLLRDADWREMRLALGARSDDAVLLIWGPARDCATAAKEVFLRLGEACVGIPPETRQAFANGTTGFERILPGPDRMYPDTDTPPLPIPDAWIEASRHTVQLRPWEKEERLVQRGLDAAVAARLALLPWFGLFEALAPATPEVAHRLAHALEKRLPRWLRARTGTRRPRLHDAGGLPLPDAHRLAPLVRALEEQTILLEALEPALDRLLAEPHVPAAKILASFHPSADDADILRAALKRVQKDAQALAGKDATVRWRWAMGAVMPEVRGRVPAAVVGARLQDALQSRRSGPSRVGAGEEAS